MTTQTLIPESELPAPRLELRWTRIDATTFRCDYNLVLPLRENDIRRECVDENGNEFEVDALTINIGQTESNCAPARSVLDRVNNLIETPFRDGAHSQWDAQHIGNPPIYAVAEGYAMRVLQWRSLL